MATIEELKQVERMIAKSLPDKNQYDRVIWQAILDILQKSEYGKVSAEATMDVPLPPGKSNYNEMMDGSFDGAIMEVLNIIQSIFNGLGNVSVEPYSEGLGTRSARLIFKAN